ncbi:fibronectin type III domain-containing protein [Bacillus paranthracis]|uniref:fibronectin type III domain-containing protein n=1 Tax=Bacillus paranthracis TaxID=2026186 RepID=UPI00283CF3BC|nr:fibronectin type III domain-containing protein [Bacillus paranthracis]MDR4166171.1 fibronectin type III domain-containing protein [Bacillus paranthracis]
MTIKKCVILFFSIFSFVLLGDIGKVYAADVDVLSGKVGYLKNNPNAKFVNMTDGNPSTSNMFYHASSSPVYFDLGKNYDITGFEMNASARGGFDRLYIQYLDSDFNVLKSYNNTISQKGIVKNVRYINFSYVYINEINVYEFYVFANDGKLSELKDLKADVGKDQVSLSWKNPQEESLSGLKVYQDNKMIATLGKESQSYVVKNLKPSKEYEFKVTALDDKGYETNGLKTKVKTTMPIIEPPEKISITPQDGSLIISWDNVDLPYLKGYNVYVDGVKVNQELLNSNKMILKNLENGKKYNIQVSAVNKNDVEGEKSKSNNGSPSSDALTVEYDVKIPFSPLDLLTSSVSLLAIIGGFVLLSIAIIWFRPLKELIVKAVRREKDKK